MGTNVLIESLHEVANKWDRDNLSPPTLSAAYSVTLCDVTSRLKEHGKTIAETQKPDSVPNIEDLQCMNG